MAVRCARVSTEVLGQDITTSKVRLTRCVVEVLGSGVTSRNARLTRCVVEVLGSSVQQSSARLTRVAAEALGRDVAAPKVRLSRIAVEVLKGRPKEIPMFEIAAPYPGLQTTTILPDPEFSDTEALTDSVAAKRATDGTLYTYVKTRGGRRKKQWTFQLTRNKALELRAFLFAYFASPIRVLDHNERVWIGHFTNNPFEFTADRKAGPAIQGWPKGETQTITLEFEGVEQ